MSGSNYFFLTCIQISQEAGKGVWYFHLFKNFPQFVVIHIIKCFCLVNEAEVDFFLNLLAFSMIKQMLAIWFLVLLPFLNLVWIWKFLVHVLLKPSLRDFDHYFANMWNEHNSFIVWIHSIFCPAFQFGLAVRTMYLRLGVVTIARLGLCMDLDTGSLRSRCWQGCFL